MKRKVSTFPSTGKASANSVESGQQKWGSTFAVRPRDPLRSQPGAGTAISSPPISAPRTGQPACGWAVHLPPARHWLVAACSSCPSWPATEASHSQTAWAAHHNQSQHRPPHHSGGRYCFWKRYPWRKLHCRLPGKGAVHQGSYGAIAFMAATNRRKGPLVRARLTMEP